jgi:hypothetical protein
MKFVLPLAAGLLLWPLAAGAQGYTGVMPPQQGFRAPPAATAKPAYNGPGGHLDSPYSGTGASQESGYASVTDTGDSSAGEAQTEAEMEVAAEPLSEDEDAAPPPTSAFTASFAPKEKPEDEWGTAGTSIYDTVNANAGTPAERRRKALLRKVEAAQRKAQREIERANAERARQTRAMVNQTLEDQRRKREGEDGEGEADAGYTDPSLENQGEGDLTDVHNR